MIYQNAPTSRAESHLTQQDILDALFNTVLEVLKISVFENPSGCKCNVNETVMSSFACPNFVLNSYRLLLMHHSIIWKVFVFTIVNRDQFWKGAKMFLMGDNPVKPEMKVDGQLNHFVTSSSLRDTFGAWHPKLLEFLCTAMFLLLVILGIWQFLVIMYCHIATAGQAY